jgi:AP-3 complex subunit beta
MKRQSPLLPTSHPRPNIQTASLASTRRPVPKAFYSDDEDESYDDDDNDAQSNLQPFYNPATPLSLDTNPPMGTSTLADTRDPYKDEDDHLDEDHRLLLRSSIPLLKSRNSAVVLAVCSLHYYCGVSSIKVSTPLLTCLESTCTFCFSLESRTDL